jgi:hypothetical protein
VGPAMNQQGVGSWQHLPLQFQHNPYLNKAPLERLAKV